MRIFKVPFLWFLVRFLKNNFSKKKKYARKCIKSTHNKIAREREDSINALIEDNMQAEIDFV